MKRMGQVAVAAVALVASAKVAAAQLPGIPYSPVETGTGISVAADYGDPQGTGKAYGLTAGIGFSRFGLSVSAGALDSGGVIGSATSFGGRLGMKLLGGGLNPISVGAQVGANSTEAIAGGSRTTVIMPGIWVRVSPPLFPLKPWGQVYYATGNNSFVDEVRFSVGANFNLLFGLGVHAGYDWGNKGGKGWGVGAHFNFRLPGVPMVPGV